MSYEIGTRDYVCRARKRLDEGIPESLFYASLELRFGIEARLQKYLDVINELPQKKKKGWRIADLGKNIENIFRGGNKLVKLEFLDSTRDKILAEFIYTPVSKKLIKDGERIGELLHSKKHYKTQNANWYSKTKVILESIYAELEFANKGTLLGPPLYHPKLKRFDLAIEFFDGYDPSEIYEKIGGEGTKFILNLSYPDN